MRLGKRPKRSKSSPWKTADFLGKPKYCNPKSVVGQLNADLVASVYSPWIQETALHVLEDYVSAWTDYQEVAQQQNETSAASSMSVDAEGTVQVDMTRETPSPQEEQEQEEPIKPAFHSKFALKELDETLTDVSDYFFGRDAEWLKVARAARFERFMIERYGVFLPFVKAHPELEGALRTLQLRWQQGYFSPFRHGPPPIPRSTAVIILFMMHRGGTQWQITALAALFFLIGLQPWALVALLVLGHTLMQRRRAKPPVGMAKRIPRQPAYYRHMSEKQKEEALMEPVGTTISQGQEQQEDVMALSEKYDIILLGSGVPTLYTAALLSRAGRQVLVLCPSADASGCVTLQGLSDNRKLKKEQIWSRVPFDIDASSVAKISKQQAVLAPALASDADAQGGVRFAQVGTAADGYAFEILSLPGVGTEKLSQSIPWIITADPANILQDSAAWLGDGWPGADGAPGQSALGAFLKAAQGINGSASLYYLNKILPGAAKAWQTQSTYAACAVRYTDALLNRSFPLNVHVRALCAGLGVCKVENLPPRATSLAPHLTHLCAATSGEGMHYPVGGPRALARALQAVIEGAGGRVVTNARAQSLVLDENALGTTGASSAGGSNTKHNPYHTPCPTCRGVKLAGSNAEILLRTPPPEAADRTPPPAVIDNQGFLHAFIHCLPEDIRVKYKVPRGLPALREARPVFKILLALEGSSEELNLTGADYYRLPNATRPQDEVTHDGQTRFGDIGWSSDEDKKQSTQSSIASTSNSNTDDDKANGKPLVETVNEDAEASETNLLKRDSTFSKGRNHYRSGESWLHISFPSAKDPSFTQRHGNITTCVITVEADDDFCQEYDTRPHLFVSKPAAKDSTKLQRLLEMVKADVLTIYPQLEGKIVHAEMQGIIARGLSHTPERYAAQGLRPETPYPGLFVGGTDLTLGGSFAAAIVAGWLTANAVVGYSYLDLIFLGKNITVDITQFLQEQEYEGDADDVAVPYTPPPPPPPQSVGTDASMDVLEE